MNAQLVGRIRPGATETFDVRGDEVVLGREPGEGISIPATGVSRRHARIVWDGKRHWIEDLESKNGTYLNGTPVTRERLRHLDVVTLGRKVDLVFVIRDERAAPATRQGMATPTPEAAVVADAPRYPEDWKTKLDGSADDTAPTPITSRGLETIREVRLTGRDTALSVTAPGPHDLGRSPDVPLSVNDGTVSRRHARITLADDRRTAWVEHLGGANGTRLNGAPVTEPQPLSDGDRVEVGDLALTVTIVSATAAD